MDRRQLFLQLHHSSVAVLLLVRSRCETCLKRFNCSGHIGALSQNSISLKFKLAYARAVSDERRAAYPREVSRTVLRSQVAKLGLQLPHVLTSLVSLRLKLSSESLLYNQTPIVRPTSHKNKL